MKLSTQNGVVLLTQQVKYLMEQLRLVCNELKDENEIAVIKKYGSNARFYTAALTCKRQYDTVCSKHLFVHKQWMINQHKMNKHPTFYEYKEQTIYIINILDNFKGFTASFICTMFTLPIWPHILDAIMSANESSTRHTIHIATEYFVDPDKYYYLSLLHIDASCFIGATVLIAVGTMMITYLKHTCGMFRIAR